MTSSGRQLCADRGESLTRRDEPAMNRRARDGKVSSGDFSEPACATHICGCRALLSSACTKKEHPSGCSLLCKQRARDGTRTRGLNLGKVALHQLSHSRITYVLSNTSDSIPKYTITVKHIIIIIFTIFKSG